MVRSTRSKSGSTTNSPDLLPGTLDMMILKTLAALGSQHGYGVARRIAKVSGEVLVVEEGSLYPALHRLEKRGCVASEWRPSENNRRAKYYTITRTGQAQLKRQTDTWSRQAAAVEKVMNAARFVAVG